MLPEVSSDGEGAGTKGSGCLTDSGHDFARQVFTVNSSNIISSEDAHLSSQLSVLFVQLGVFLFN